MIIFKTFLKVLNKVKLPVILFTSFLIFFGGFNTLDSNNSSNFAPTKPDVLIINNDNEIGITKNLVDYIKKNSIIPNIKNNDEAINDALFYRDINYIIYIPENYRKDFLNNKNPKIEIKGTGTYQASLAEMILKRYLKVADAYNSEIKNEEELIKNINSTLAKNIEVELTSKLNIGKISKVTFYYNFLNYSVLAGSIYVVCLILSIFNDEKIRKRTIISSMNYKEYNRKLLFSNSVFIITLWLFYVFLSYILIGDIMFTAHGIIYIINSLFFTLCSLTMAFLISSLIKNKNAINGIINVIALGSSFLCGAFVPMELLPKSVLKIAHVLPSYYYIKTNEILKGIQTFDFEIVKPIIINIIILVLYGIIFIIITNIISNKKRKVG